MFYFHIDFDKKENKSYLKFATKFKNFPEFF